MTGKPIPYSDIETLFLDAGNTLVSIDFEWVSAELGLRGIEVGVEALRRAEAAARPTVSAAVAEAGSSEGPIRFEFYVGAVLEQLEVARAFGSARLAAVVDDLVPVLNAPGATSRLWSWMLPGVPAALAALRDAGLTLAVVSNSDGSVEQGLGDLGIRDYFAAVIDSQVVGFEKPDPRIFECALDVVGSDPLRTLHVGDLYSADVTGARAAGIHALLLDPYEDWEGVDCERRRDVAEVSRALLAGRRAR